MPLRRNTFGTTSGFSASDGAWSFVIVKKGDIFMLQEYVLGNKGRSVSESFNLITLIENHDLKCATSSWRSPGALDLMRISDKRTAMVMLK